MQTSEKVYVPAPKVWERYGVSSVTGWRWLQREDLRFPRPIYVGRLRFFLLSDLEVWEQSRPREMPRKAG